MTSCGAPGSLGRHVLAEPDWAGRQVCGCGAVRRYPPGSHAQPAVDPWWALLELLQDLRDAQPAVVDVA